MANASSSSRSAAFPGRVIKKGDPDRVIVRVIQRRLRQLGCGPLTVDGDFGPQTLAAVKLFQARSTDTDGMPLVIDGKVGAITWAALFGAASIPSANETTEVLLSAVLRIARAQVGVTEEPPGSNRGPRVDEYARRVGLDPRGKHPWCAAFVYWCFDEGASSLNRPNPVVRTAGCLDHWARAGQMGIRRIPASKAVNDPQLVRPGQIFIIDTGSRGGAGHTGLVEAVTGGKIVTIEGNTNEGGSAEGTGVYRRVARKILQINKGFIDYGAGV